MLQYSLSDMDTETSNNQDQDYYKSYENFAVHRLMLEDKSRTESYKNSILSSNSFKDKVVMDVGAGTGILSLFCAQAGARKVYAVEASNLALTTMEVVKENNLDHVIEVLNCKVEDLTDDIKVDILVSEWMGFFLLHESMIDSIIIARDKHLNPGGLIYPEHATLQCSPCSTPDLLDFWDNVYGAKMSAMKKAVRNSLATKPEITTLRPENLLCEPRTLLSIDMNTVSLYDIMHVSSQVFVSTERAGTYQGVALWFEVTFPKGNENDHEAVVLSTAVTAPSTHWQQTVVVWPEDQIVEEGDVLAFEIEFERSDTTNRQYNIHVRELDAAEDEHPVPCACGSPRCNIISAFISKCPDDDDTSGEDLPVAVTEAADESHILQNGV
jgi:predicted RNA methylase